MTVGITNKKSVVVDKTNVASTVGSGLLDVFSTPSMIALMEATASESVEKLLESGMTTVGTKLDISHVSATPEGQTVTCESTLVSADGRKLVFSVKAFDEAGLIGEGTHERFIVNAERFMQKTLEKNK